MIVSPGWIIELTYSEHENTISPVEIFFNLRLLIGLAKWKRVDLPVGNGMLIPIT
jgi:hypothetical protein